MFDVQDRVASWEYPNIVGTVIDVVYDESTWWTEDFHTQLVVQCDDGKVRTNPVGDWVAPGETVDGCTMASISPLP
jgi:hypothetical protein